MREPVKFKCPRCGCEANAYSQVMAGCISCGVLLYTEIPQEVKSQLTQRAADVLITCAHCGNYHSVYIPCPSRKANPTRRI